MWKSHRLRPLVRQSGLGRIIGNMSSQYYFRTLVKSHISLSVCSERTYATKLTRSAISTAVSKLVLPVSNDIQARPEVCPNYLPTASIGDGKIAVGWNAENWSRYHYIWLRDHCRCPKCFHSITKQRIVNTFEIASDIRPIQVEPMPEGLKVIWLSVEPHVSVYPWAWLKTNSYDPPLRAEHVSGRPITWGAEMHNQAPPSVTYKEVMEADDQGLFKWLSYIDSFGFCFISGVPLTTGATKELLTRISFIRETHWGKFWEVTSGFEQGDTAYTTMALDAHTDNTYFTDPAGIQLFHLLSHKNGTGGATLLVDGFYVASILKELQPKAYDILSRVPIHGHAAGELTAMFKPSPPSGYPVLSHDPFTGVLTQVRWNNYDRSVMNTLDSHLVEDWYNAVRIWHKHLTSPSSEYWVQLAPGTAVVTNNHRVLHGRAAFEGNRHLCGAYVGMDDFRSRLAVLTEKFAASSNADANIRERSVWNPAL